MNRTPLQTAIQTFLLEEDELAGSCYIFFEQTNRTCLVSQHRGLERINQKAVLPHVVRADAVHAGSVMSPQGELGTLFTLTEEGTRTATIEVYSDRLVLVHASYSRAAVEGGVVPPATRLVFRPDHRAQMEAAMGEVHDDPDLTYIPLTEVLWGRANKNLLVCGDAGRVWKDVNDFLGHLNAHVVSAVDSHNARECLHAGIVPGELPSSRLAAVFCA